MLAPCSAQCVRHNKDQYRTRKKQLKKRTQQQLKELGTGTKSKLRKLRKRRDDLLKTATEKYEPHLFRLRRTHEGKMQAEIEQHAAQLATLQGRRQERVEQTRDRFGKLRDENNRRHAEDWTNLAVTWKQACDAIAGTFQQVDRDSRRWFADWNPSPQAEERGLPWGLRFGKLAVTPERIPDGVPEDGQLVKPDWSGSTVPAFLPFPERMSLLIEANEHGRSEGIRALEAILLRAWLALPPGKLRCTIIDPVGRGENFAAFMHLADHERALVNSRIWTETGAHRAAADRPDRAHGERPAEVSCATSIEIAGRVQRPGRRGRRAVPLPGRRQLPGQLQPRGGRRLLSLASAGARCGIYTFVLADTRQPLPHGVDLGDLEKACTLLVWHDDRFVWQDEDFGRFPLHARASRRAKRLCTQSCRTSARRRSRRMRVEVPFASIAPPQDELVDRRQPRGHRRCRWAGPAPTGCST